MACYCQYCRFVYPENTSNCFSCGRPLSRDNNSYKYYLDNGYRAIGELESNQSTVVDGADFTVLQENESNSINQSTTSSKPISATSSISKNAAAAVLQGEDIPRVSTQNATPTNITVELAEETNIVNQEMEHLHHLQAEQERQRRALNRSIRRHNRATRLIAMPWRYILRGLLFILIIVLLIIIWNMRYTIFKGITSIILALLPLILVIYLLIALFRGHF